MVVDQIPDRTFIFRTAARPRFGGTSRPNGEVFHQNAKVYINQWWQTKSAKADGNLRPTGLLRRPKVKTPVVVHELRRLEGYLSSLGGVGASMAHLFSTLWLLNTLREVHWDDPPGSLCHIMRCPASAAAAAQPPPTLFGKK